MLDVKFREDDSRVRDRAAARNLALLRKRPCCTDQGCGRSCPSPGFASGNTDGDRASELHHTVERVDGDVHLGRPTLVRARAQPVTDGL